MAQLDSKKQAVFDRIDQFQDEMVQLASDLVKFPSLYQKEEEVQKFVAQRLENMGANVDLCILTLSRCVSIRRLRQHARVLIPAPMCVVCSKAPVKVDL